MPLKSLINQTNIRETDCSVEGEKTQQSSDIMLSTTCKCFSNPYHETTTGHFYEVADKWYFFQINDLIPANL